MAGSSQFDSNGERGIRAEFGSVPGAGKEPPARDNGLSHKQ
jgi:hypothetical protein